MYLIVGLGNPGREYDRTRHNAGFMVVDHLANSFSFAPFKAKFDGLIAEGKIGTKKVFLLKPQTFMNLSGNAVVKAAHFYKILPQNIIVIHDDMDLPLGKVKAKCGGGAGGHNGLKSIDAVISPNYNRIRIGVGHGADAVRHVLSPFSMTEQEAVDAAVKLVEAHIEILLNKGMPEFSNAIGNAQAIKE